MPIIHAKDHLRNGRTLKLTSTRLQETNDPGESYALTLKEFRRAYRANDGTCRIKLVRPDGKLSDIGLLVTFFRPVRDGGWDSYSEGRIGCCFFTRQEFLKVYRKAFNKTVTKARAAKAGV